ncbi:MAG TPA: serine hydrolase [Kofleriaceae bacterium]
MPRVIQRRYGNALIVDNADYRVMVSSEAVRKRYPSEADKLRVALVDLTGNKLCRPGYAGWGSTWPMPGGSTAKIAIVYAAHQLLFDLAEMARAGGISTAAALKSAAASAWSGLSCKPDVDWLVTIDASTTPVGVAASANLTRHLDEMVDASFSDVSTSRASELILRIGFEYIASLMWQSGLRHPTRAGLWLGNLFMDVSFTAKTSPTCHSGTNPVSWKQNPLGATGITLTGLSAATYFTLLAQGRLVNPTTSTRIEALLRKGCRFISIPGATVRATKCGLTSSVRHDAALIENGSRRYVMVVLTKNASWSLNVRDRFLNDLDRLIKDNNP